MTEEGKCEKARIAIVMIVHTQLCVLKTMMVVVMMMTIAMTRATHRCLQWARTKLDQPLYPQNLTPTPAAG